MKKLLLLAIVMLLAISTLAGITTGKSIFYADSYMLRARGVEASYWNPANLIPSKYIDLWLPGINTGVSVSNNSLDLDTYNFVVGQEYLDQADKEKILSKIDGSLRGSLRGSTSVLGVAMGNMSFSSSVHYMAQAALSERYLELLLYGNTDTLYVFDNSTTDFRGLSYIDFTFGAGNFAVPFLPEDFPKVRAGFSISGLVGLTTANVEHFYGTFSTGFDGITLNQEIVLRSGIGGHGRKAMLGLASNITPTLQAGITLDNIFGQITWSAVSQENHLLYVADSLYAIDISEDFYEETNETYDIPEFSTELPPELRIAAMWSKKKYNLSADYVQGFKNSASTSKIGRLSMGAQVFPLPFLPLTFGMGFGNSDIPWHVSYGFGLKSSTAEIGFSVQSFDGMLPGTKSKGVSFGSFIRLWI